MDSDWMPPKQEEKTMGQELFSSETTTVKGPAAGTQSYRPILYIGLGGMGCRAIIGLKTLAEKLPEEARRRMAFIAMDTQPSTDYAALGQNQYVELGRGIDPQVVARGDAQRLGWWEELRGAYAAPMVTAGAGKVRGVGRIALLHGPTVNRFLGLIDHHANALMTGIQRGTVEPKVYLISSVAGGTGAGCLLDVCQHVRRRMTRQVGASVRIQGIFISPDVLYQEAPRADHDDFKANAYAVLKEMLHLYSSVRGELYAPDTQGIGEAVFHRTDLPGPIFFLTGINEKGTVVADRKEEVIEIVDQYLLAEMRTLVSKAGDAKIQDGENSMFTQVGNRAMPRFLSSFGLVRVGVPISLLEQVVSLKILEETIAQETALEKWEDEATQWVRAWIDRNDLAEDSCDRLQMAIRSDGNGSPIDVPVDVAGTILKKSYPKMMPCAQQEFDDHVVSLQEQFEGILQDNASAISSRSLGEFEARFLGAYSEGTLAGAVQLLREAKLQLKQHLGAVEQELQVGLVELENLRRGVGDSVGLVGQAAVAGIFTRGRLTRDAVGLFQETLQNFLRKQVEVWSREGAKSVYDSMLQKLDDLEGKWDRLKDLKSRVEMSRQKRFDLAVKLSAYADFDRRGPGNFISLVGPGCLDDLYSSWLGAERVGTIARRARQAWRKSGLLLSVEAEAAWLSVAVGPVEKEVKEGLSGFTVLASIQRYYQSEADLRGLFDRLQVLGSSLFPVDPNRREDLYQKAWVVSAHADLMAAVKTLCAQYFSKDEGGLTYAQAETPYELGFYSLTHGFTAHSLTRMSDYLLNYEKRQRGYQASLAGQGAAIPPVHGWLGAEAWREVTPRSDEDAETLQWFILGRAFSHLFPSAVTAEGRPDDRKNQAFVYRRGSYYYVDMPEKKGRRIVNAELRLGNSLSDAVKAFQLKPHVREHIQKLVEKELHDRGAAEIGQRLVSEYLPVLDEELEATRRSKASRDGSGFEKARLLAEMKGALEEYITYNLGTEGA